MDLNEILMHYRAAREYGKERSCGTKIRFETEAGANSSAKHLNERPEVQLDMRPRQEAYPCPFCFSWHTGREMTYTEREKWYATSDTSKYRKVRWT